MFSIKSNQIHNLVVFVGSSEFKTEMPENVTEGTEFIDYIKSKTEAVITDAQTEIITNKLEFMRLEDSRETDRRHINNLKRNN